MDQRRAFDQQKMRDRLGGDEKLIAEVLRLFGEESSTMIADVSSAVSSGEASRLERAAHAFRGALVSVSAEPAAEVAGELERLGHNGTLEDAETQLSRLAREIELLNVELGGVRD